MTSFECSGTVGFEADYERSSVTIGGDGARTESRELFRLYRDSTGRMRMEGSTPAGGRTLRFAWLTDFRTRRAVVLDLETGQPLEQEPWRPPETAGAPAPTNKSVSEAPTVEDLGETEIEGLVAHGHRYTTSSATVEVWTASMIDQPPLLITSKESTVEKVERLFNVRVGEPDPGLFASLDAS